MDDPIIFDIIIRLDISEDLLVAQELVAELCSLLILAMVENLKVINVI